MVKKIKFDTTKQIIVRFIVNEINKVILVYRVNIYLIVFKKTKLNLLIICTNENTTINYLRKKIPISCKENNLILIIFNPLKEEICILHNNLKYHKK